MKKTRPETDYVDVRRKLSQLFDVDIPNLREAMQQLSNTMSAGVSSINRTSIVSKELVHCAASILADGQRHSPLRLSQFQQGVEMLHTFQYLRSRLTLANVLQTTAPEELQGKVTITTLYNDIYLNKGFFNRMGMSFVGNVNFNKNRHTSELEREWTTMCSLGAGSYNLDEDVASIVPFDPKRLDSMCTAYFDSGNAREMMLTTLLSLVIESQWNYVTYGNYNEGSYTMHRDNEFRYFMASNVAEKLSKTVKGSNNLLHYYSSRSNKSKKLPVTYARETGHTVVTEIKSLILLLFGEEYTTSRMCKITEYNNGAFTIKFPKHISAELVSTFNKRWKEKS